ncbi:MAG: HDOD domain-containing protein [Candidatus Eisenbacteria bacterium]|nr:HDOD domain-containing protein [Candidatus Eisenbacteria bacterium]
MPPGRSGTWVIPSKAADFEADLVGRQAPPAAMHRSSMPPGVGLMTKKSVIFVDDQPNVLEALRRTLRSMRNDWDMRFAGSGKEALNLLDQHPSDVIITDMRMPEMGGEELLMKVKDLYPETIRLVLSGQSTRDAVMKAMSITHDFLPKPCEGKVIRATLEQVGSIVDDLRNPALRSIIGKLGDLPSRPETFAKLVETLKSQDVTPRELAGLIENDPAMTARVLQLANSAFFGLRQKISNPLSAVTYLGVDNVRSLVLALSVFTAFTKKGVSQKITDEIWDHCVATGIGAKAIMKEEEQSSDDVEAAFTAGLLHDCGTLLLASYMPEEFTAIAEAVCTKGITPLEAEAEILGVTHANIGGYFTETWSLPHSITQAVNFHLQPSKSMRFELTPLTAVHVADAADRLDLEKPELDLSKHIDMDYLERLGVQDRLTHWIGLCADVQSQGRESD